MSVIFELERCDKRTCTWSVVTGAWHDDKAVVEKWADEHNKALTSEEKQLTEYRCSEPKYREPGFRNSSLTKTEWESIHRKT